MHIIFSIRYFHPFVGGTEKQALTLASRLVAKGVAVTVLTSRFHSSWQGAEIIEGVRVIRLWSPRVKVLGALIFLACMAGYLMSQRRHYSLIHTFQISYTSFFSILVARLLKKPSLLKLASSGSGGDIQRAKRTLWGRIFLGMAKKATRIITVSSTMEQELLKEQIPSPHISRIANGVDLAHYRPQLNKSEMRRRANLQEKKTIIYTGRLSPEKGVAFLISSFASMERKEQCQLVIVAEGPERKRILKMIGQLALEGSIILVSNSDDVSSYLNASDLFVLPSHFEGLSNALLEAMACGLPIISTRVGGSIDIIDSGINGVLVDVHNREQLSNAMIKLLHDQQLSDKLGRNARKTVEEQFDLSRIADNYLAVYRTIHGNEHVGDTHLTYTKA